MARDEEQALNEAANAQVEEMAQTGQRQNLQALRERAAAAGGVHIETSGPSTPAENVNFFSEEEAAERKAEADAAKAREDRRLTARLMPDLDLGKSAREPAPWYALPAPAPNAEEEAEVARALGYSGSSGRHCGVGSEAPC